MHSGVRCTCIGKRSASPPLALDGSRETITESVTCSCTNEQELVMKTSARLHLAYARRGIRPHHVLLRHEAAQVTDMFSPHEVDAELFEGIHLELLEAEDVEHAAPSLTLSLDPEVLRGKVMIFMTTGVIFWLFQDAGLRNHAWRRYLRYVRESKGA